MRPAPSAAPHTPRSRSSSPMSRSAQLQPYVVAMRSALRHDSSAAIAGEESAYGSSRHDRVSGHVDADACQQVAHEGRVAQVDRIAGELLPDDAVARTAGGGLLGLAARARAHGGGQERVERGPVDRQAVELELDAQQSRHRLRECDEGRQRRRSGCRSTVGQRPHAVGLPLLEGQRQLGPAASVVQVCRPVAAQPLAAQVPVGAHGVGRVAVAGEVEQGELALRPVGRRQAERRRPHRARVVAVEAVQQPADGAEVPARAGPGTGGHERQRGLPSRPPHPAGAVLGLDTGDLGVRRGRGDHRGPAVPGEPHPQIRCDGERERGPGRQPRARELVTRHPVHHPFPLKGPRAHPDR